VNFSNVIIRKLLKFDRTLQALQHFVLDKPIRCQNLCWDSVTGKASPIISWREMHSDYSLSITLRYLSMTNSPTSIVNVSSRQPVNPTNLRWKETTGSNTVSSSVQYRQLLKTRQEMRHDGWSETNTDRNMTGPSNKTIYCRLEQWPKPSFSLENNCSERTAWRT